MILAIDIGNTRIKGAVFENDTATASFSADADNASPAILSFLQKHPEISDVVVASVGADGDFSIQLRDTGVKVHFISHNSAFPFNNKYTTPLTLGIDRMVLAAGAMLSYPDKNRVVIDAGSCITYDFVDAAGTYHGGAISPGLQMRYTAMHKFTAKLPLLKAAEPLSYIGNSTAASMHSGVVNGLAGEIDGFIDRYTADYPNIIIILTGGDTEFLAKRLKNTIFANSNFLLESLNLTFHYSNHK